MNVDLERASVIGASASCMRAWSLYENGMEERSVDEYISCILCDLDPERSHESISVSSDFLECSRL